MATREALQSGNGYLNETSTRQYFIPGWGFVNETVAGSNSDLISGLIGGGMIGRLVSGLMARRQM